MISFKQLLEKLELFEAAKHKETHEDSSQEEIKAVLDKHLAKEKHDDPTMLTIGYALKHLHPEKHPEMFHDTMNRMAGHKTAYYRSIVAGHPHTSEETLKQLATDKAGRVSRTAQENLARRSGEAPAKPAPAPKPTKTTVSKPVTPKPAAKPVAGGYGIEKADPEESPLGYDADSVHHITHNGKIVGAVTSSRHEDGGRSIIKSWKGHPDKGFDQLGKHADLHSAMKHLVSSHKQ